MKFKHEMDEAGWHRIIEMTTNTIGDWALYSSPAFLKVRDDILNCERIFSALTSNYSGIEKSFPPIETVFEMIIYPTECNEVTRLKPIPKRERKNKKTENTLAGWSEIINPKKDLK